MLPPEATMFLVHLDILEDEVGRAGARSAWPPVTDWGGEGQYRCYVGLVLLADMVL